MVTRLRVGTQGLWVTHITKVPVIMLAPGTHFRGLRAADGVSCMTHAPGHSLLSLLHQHPHFTEEDTEAWVSCPCTPSLGARKTVWPRAR